VKRQIRANGAVRSRGGAAFRHVAAAAFLLFVGVGVAQGDPQEGVVEVFLSPDLRPCSFVKLAGDPQWYALAKSNHGYWEMFSILFKARQSGGRVTVHTIGGTVCGADGVPQVGAGHGEGALVDGMRGWGGRGGGA